MPLKLTGSIADRIKMIEEQHKAACIHFKDFFERLEYPTDFVNPRCLLRFRTSKCSGIFYGVANMCEYGLSYAMLNHKFYETVWHEVTHSAQWQIDPNSEKHGSLFRFLYRSWCNWQYRSPSAMKHHSYSPTLAKKLDPIIRNYAKAAGIYDEPEIKIDYSKSQAQA